MVFFAVILSLVPLTAFAVSRRAALEKTSAIKTALWILAVFALGLIPAAPMLTSRGVGNGEAYNYSLAVADFVTQVRAGELPPLIGQTEFAFNGRVHPLANAPYLFYLAAILDGLSFRQLSFWELQNLSLAFSLVAAAFAAYGCLRWSTLCSRPTAFFLTAAYLFCPAVLANTTVNLFMTVHVAVFVPIAIGAVVRQARGYSLQADIALGAALAAAWLAHPPVAMWLSTVTAFVRFVIHWRDPVFKVRAGLYVAMLFALAAASFGFASVFAVNADLGYFSDSPAERLAFVNALLANVRGAFPGSLLPVRATADSLRDVQLGFTCWALLGGAVVACLFMRPASGETASVDRRRTTVSLLGAALLLLLLLVPIKYVTRWLWTQIPFSVATTTGPWPMQRLYLVIAGIAVFSAALTLPVLLARWPKIRRALPIFAVIASCWMAWQAGFFLRRDFQLQWNEDSTRRSHVSSNLDLTLISYAYLGLPPTFVNGVMDPALEFRLLKAGKQEVASPLKTAMETAPIVARGSMVYQPADGHPTIATQGEPLRLEPGRRYLLTFTFLTPPFTGTIDVIGPMLLRHYALPAAGEPRGFGMNPDQPHAFSVWTSLQTAESVQVRCTVSQAPADWKPGLKLAEFSLHAIALEQLPVRLESLLPLRCTVSSTESDSMLVTPRRYLHGYVATVNGRTMRAVRSPEGNVMLPVPAGESVVELRYAGNPLVRAAFWLSAASWAAFLAWAGGLLVGIDWKWIFAGIGEFLLPPALWIGRRKRWIAGTVAAAALVLLVVARRETYLHSIGPVHIRFLLPQLRTGRQQPLLVTGKKGAGATVFVAYIDETHVRIGADIWGTVYLTDPLKADYTQVQDLVVNSSALYPLDHPGVRALDPAFREQLRRDFRVEFNGHTVIHETRLAYESTLGEIAFGEARIGGSLTQPRFDGKILSVDRLPFQHRRPVVVSRDQNARMRLRFPREHFGITETLFSLGLHGRDGVCAVLYESIGRARLTVRRPDNTVVASAVVNYDPGKSHDLEIAFGPATSDTTLPTLKLSFDGKPVLGPEILAAADRPWILQAGFTETEIPGVDARFMGPTFALQTVPKNPQDANLRGPLRFIAIFPRDKIGRPEPLLATGKNGAGDFAYITYLDANHVRFGLDHWGVGGAASGPIEVEYAAPHEIEIRMSSLYPPTGDPSWKKIPAELRERYRSQMEIFLDGKPVLEGPWPAHPSKPEEITPGANRIGGSNCDPVFTGEILASDRLPWPPGR